MIDTEAMEWLQPWEKVEGSAANLERQLNREVTEGHPLFGLSVTALARRRDTDDVVFAVGVPTRRLAAVHLTWAGRQEPPFPETDLFETFEAFRAAVMEPGHAEA